MTIVLLQNGDQLGPRIGTDTFEPLTPEDAKLMKGQFKTVCDKLTPKEKQLLERSTRDAFFGDFLKAQRRASRFKAGAFGVLMSNTYEETCDKDILQELDDECY